ncbi:hypothetical protein ACQKGD_12735 [Peribacillus frigoritolerans]|uniref:Uncharacterized protein n=1 Tax=Peribacillus frigoritolerans TaxID=450367 RepID=A0AAJ1QP54_9BACI|nr:hypothetical protein [Peribacillus frigoritolerans]MDM5285189.1 hypothetical protein [Peribacillus frigoritolerans]USK63123.1 hypothetical protein LIT26_17975 [Peribacillus frigoritolerans]
MVSFRNLFEFVAVLEINELSKVIISIISTLRQVQVAIFFTSMAASILLIK